MPAKCAARGHFRKDALTAVVIRRPNHVCRRLDIGEELQNLRPQPIRIARVELARHRRRPGRHVLQTGLHLSRFRLTTILNVSMKLRPSAT